MRQSLDLAVGSKVQKFTRLCLLGGEPALLEHGYASAARFPDLWNHRLDRSFLSVVEKVYRVRPKRNRVTLMLDQFPKDIASSLNAGDPPIGIVLEQTVFDEDDRPIYLGKQYWRGDVAKFSAEVRV